MADSTEKEPLIISTSKVETKKDDLSMLFAIACIVDQFGVNPIIVLPRAIILCGWIGFPLSIVVFGLTIYTAMLLGRCWVIAELVDPHISNKVRYPYAGLVEIAWGRRCALFMSIFLNIAVFTSNLPALLIASQNLQTFDAKITNYQSNFSYCYWIIILGAALCPLTWLGSPKDMKWISVSSTCAVCAAAILTWTCMFWDNTRAFAYRDIPSPNWQSIGIAYGILSFQLSCHPAMLAIQSDMSNKTKLSHSILCSFIITGGLFLTTTLLAMMLYGGGVRANLTQGLPVTLPLYMDILIITLQLFLSMAVGGCALFNSVEDWLNVPTEFCWQRCALRTLFVALGVFIAESLPRFDLVMGVFGGVFTGPITLIFPPLLYLTFKKKLCLFNTINTRNEDEEEGGEDKEERLIDPNDDDTGEEAQIIQNKTEYDVTENDVFSRFYKFLRKNIFSLDVDLTQTLVPEYEKVCLVFITILGILATAIATYYSIRGAVWSAKFVPPCMVNVTAASRVIDS